MATRNGLSKRLEGKYQEHEKGSSALCILLLHRRHGTRRCCRPSRITPNPNL